MQERERERGGGGVVSDFWTSARSAQCRVKPQGPAANTAFTHFITLMLSTHYHPLTSGAAIKRPDFWKYAPFRSEGKNRPIQSELYFRISFITSVFTLVTTGLYPRQALLSLQPWSSSSSPPSSSRWPSVRSLCFFLKHKIFFKNPPTKQHYNILGQK